MRNNRAIAAVIVSTLLLSSYVVAESSKKYTMDISDPTDGDYFSYSLDLSGMMSAMMEDDEEIVDISNNVDPTATMTYLDESCSNLVGDCYRLSSTMLMNYTMTHPEGSDYTDDTVTKLTITSITEYGENQAHEESTTTMDLWLQVDGVDYYLESVETETTSTTLSSGGEPEEVSVGDSWTTTKEYDTITTERSRLDGGEWDTETTESSGSVTTNYNAESSGNVFVDGTSFDSIRISSQDIGDSSKTVSYSSEHGIPVKMEEYEENGELGIIMSLVEYRYANEPGDDSQLPGFGAMAVTSMLAIATILTRKKSEQ